MEAERRQVTVLFADLVGFTSFSEKAGEEGAYMLMRTLSQLMDETVRDNGGVVQNFTGDGIMAVFGAPIAFEDAPMRACRAALSILDRLRAQSDDHERRHGLRPKLRIGLNTGVAVVGAVGTADRETITVLGDTVNVAARLQTAAEPDTAVMSDATHRLVHGAAKATFLGAREVKGKSEPHKIYRLDAIPTSSTRFSMAIGRGLGALVGRERELEVLDGAFAEARDRLQVIDIVADPGMGKSRLLYEFRRQSIDGNAFVLAGNCSPDGQQTPFLPFIEIIRGSFRITADDSHQTVSEKFEAGLTTLGLFSQLNLGLLLHLLGLKPREASLDGLDGVLIGLRTRELLLTLLDAQCRVSRTVIIVEDLHWLDSVSAELLAKIVDVSGSSHLLVAHTRRPEFNPSWIASNAVRSLKLEPLARGEVRRLVQARLGGDNLPESLMREVSDKSEGNPLFAEEILTAFAERGALRKNEGRLEFVASGFASDLPSSLENLLASRVDRLAPGDRTLLQAASAIGRRFDPSLLAVVMTEDNITPHTSAMEALDLIYTDSKSGDFLFKHALVRDALYNSLLNADRANLHARIGAEIERRNGNRLIEVAEILAHHFAQTDEKPKAFLYLSMSGTKCLNVYSLEEATTYFERCAALLDEDRRCASDEQVADFLVQYLLVLNLDAKITTTIEIFHKYIDKVRGWAKDPRSVVILYQFAHALFLNARYNEATQMQRELTLLAFELGDDRSKAYSFAGAGLIGMLKNSTSRDGQLQDDQEAIEASDRTDDPYLRNQVRFVIGFEQMFRGRMNDARVSAKQLLVVGRERNDPRSMGFGSILLGLIALFSDSLNEALEYSEQSSNLAVTPIDKLISLGNKASALILLGRNQEGESLLNASRSGCRQTGFLYGLNGTEITSGISALQNGEIGLGLRMIEQAIWARENEGLPDFADWFRLNLAEVYLQIILGGDRPPLRVLVKNLPTLLKIRILGSSRIQHLLTRVLQNPKFDPDGHFVGRAHMILGLLHKARRKIPLAKEHLLRAHQITALFGPSPMLARLDAALVDLGGGTA